MCISNEERERGDLLSNICSVFIHGVNTGQGLSYRRSVTDPHLLGSLPGTAGVVWPFPGAGGGGSTFPPVPITAGTSGLWSDSPK